jgi:Na+-translocating ferredoxin:NAD+ oxidoreductase RnfC subunit
VNLRKALKKIQKDSMRGYCRSRSISKTKIGKLVRMVPTGMVENKTKCLLSEVKLYRVLELLESNNLTGMSGNGFSVKTKLESLIQHQSQKFFLINGVECEPGLIHDEWILKNYWDEVSKGIQFICQIIPFERCVLAYKVLREDKRKKRNATGFEECVIKEKLMNCFPGDREAKYFAGSGIMSAHVIEEGESFSDRISFAAIGHSAKISNNAACKGCGMCNRKCPVGVNIKNIVKRREVDKQADISDLGIDNCIHCGSCTYFCRAGKDITEYLAK